ncbi:PAS domain S-box protein [Denitratisoma sp. DHT3]|uniref:PAS domain S-box protein n=1 Tax=Denitratisoma sp. DHT3 TaxID=1981880 RepID=UPI0016478D2E|nr:EAL domain-containing protein [Denitratisoma sp. DHT3]
MDEIARPLVRHRYPATAVIWTLLVIASVGNGWYQLRSGIESAAVTAARASISKDINFRRWASSHGGVYVPPDARTPPNPYLDVPGRDVTTADGMALTLMSPAYMLNQLQTEYAGEFGARNRITSLDPLNPNNAPQAWEAQALGRFEQGAAEFQEIVYREDKGYLRMMLPIVTERSCLKCHASQGYRVGDVRGGISAVVPLEAFEVQHTGELLMLLASHGVLWLTGSIGLGLSYRRDRRAETARRQAEGTLRRYSEIVKTSGDMLALVDRAHCYRVVNPAYARFFGTTPEALVGKPVREVLGERFYGDVQPHVAQALVGGSPHFRVTRALPGGFPHVLDAVYRLYRVGGEVVGVVASLRDVTEQSNAEQALSISEAKFRSYLAGAPIAIVVTDGDGRIAEVNPAMERLFAASRNQLIGLLISTLYDAADLERLRQENAKLESQGNIEEGEYRMHRLDGGVLWVVLRAVRLDDGRTLGFLVDISDRKAAEQSLIEREIVLRTIIETNPECIRVTNPDGTLRHVNHAGLAMFEADSLEQVVGKPVVDVVAPEWREDFLALHERVLKGESGRLQFEIRGLKGGQRWLETQEVPMRNAEGEITSVLCVTRDITEYRKSEESLRLAATAFANATDGILITDPDGTIVDVNDRFVSLTGYSREELVGGNPRIFKSGLQDADFYLDMWRDLLTLRAWAGECRNRRKDGSIYVQDLRISAVLDEEGKVTHYVGIASDITELKHSQQRLEDLAYHDLLTHLPNRVLLADRMQQAMALANRKKELLVVCYLDLDGFKPINDTWGHAAGDQLLIETAERLRGCVRTADTVSRLGGDEFVILLGGMNAMEEVEQALRRIFSVLNRPYRLPEGETIISASLGVTLYPLDGDDADALIRHADQAMYAAKQAGKNCFRLFDPEHDRASRSQREQVNRFHAAMAAGELQLHYQPKVDMRTGRLIGAEALLRWQHPENGLLAPGHFQAMLDNAELALPLGEWVLGTALRQLSSWNEQGMQINVSVNISSQHLQQRDFVERLRALLKSHPRVAPNQLMLEILESSSVEDMIQISQTIRACRAVGVSFSLDDFGTGYSSLTYLRQLPTEELKIDQSFVREMLTDREDCAIVEGVISLARTFGRQVIAEGVETPEHGVLLLSLGCHLAQGYAIARPMPAAQLPAWRRAWAPPEEWRAPA